MHVLWKAFLISLGVCLVAGPLLIPFLRRLKFGQFVRSDGPRTHLHKAGTPTMGGVMFFFSIGLGTLLAAGEKTPLLLAVLLVTLGFGLIGFFDDFIKVVLKRPLGLLAREKIAGQVILAAIFASILAFFGGRGTDLVIPAAGGIDLELGWLYLLFAVFIMVGFNNAVNLTDGLDGLATGVTFIVALVYLFLTWKEGYRDLSIFSASLSGTCLGFLFFNIRPARVFMGDTGSLTLGGAVAALAVATRTELLLLLIGGVYVLETLSVIIQVLYFRLTGGKRLFLMSPLHHHFELAGWSEQKVVFFFWFLAVVFAGLALMLAL